MGLFTPKKYGLIAAQSCRDCIRMAQVLPSLGGSPRLVTATSSCVNPVDYDVTRRSDGESQYSSVADESWRFVGRECVTCLPNDIVTSIRLRLPRMSESELDAAVHWRMAKELSVESHDIKTAHYNIGLPSVGDRGVQEVMAIASPTSDLHDLVQTFRKSSLSLQVVDTFCGALSRCLSLGLDVPWSSASKLVVFFHDQEAATILFIHHGDPCFIRHVQSQSSSQSLDVIDQCRSYVQPVRVQDMELVGASHSFHSCGQESANENLSEVEKAQRQVKMSRMARLLAHEINRCVHYLLDRGMAETTWQFGCVLGQDSVAVTNLLEELSAFKFRLLADLWSHSFRSMVSGLDDRDLLEHWIVPIGLSFYGIESMISENAE